MKDPHRIDQIMEDLKMYWKQNPDLRLCQVVSNATVKGGWNQHDVFYCSDDMFKSGLRKLINKKELEMSILKHQVHFYAPTDMLRPRGTGEKDSVSFYLTDKLNNTFEDWTDIKYHDSLGDDEAMRILIMNVISETENALNKFLKDKNMNVKQCELSARFTYNTSKGK